MKKLIFLLIVYMIFTIHVYAQSFSGIEGEFVKSFPIGKADGELGLFTAAISGGGATSPSALCFDDENNLYICDTINRRFCVFDKGFNFVKNINNTSIIEPTILEIDFEGNFIGFFGSRGIQKMGKNGEEMFFVYITDDNVIRELRDDGLYIVNNFVVGYKENGGLIGFNNLGPDYKENNRNIMDTDEVIREIQQNHPSLRIERKTPGIRQNTSSSGVPQRSSSGDEGYQIYRNGELLSRDFDTLEQSNSIQSRNLSSTSEDDGLFELYDKFKDVDGKTYYGKDNDGNEYWQFRAYMFVLDLSGTPIKAIELQSPRKRSTGFTLSPDGEIYYMYSTKDGHNLYKYKRDW